MYVEFHTVHVICFRTNDLQVNNSEPYLQRENWTIILANLYAYKAREETYTVELAM